MVHGDWAVFAFSVALVFGDLGMLGYFGLN